MSQNPTMWYNKAEITDQDLIKGIQNNEDVIIRYVYKKYFPGIRAMIFTFRDTRLIADDVFQEGLTRAVINIRNGKFEGRSSFNTYLTGICRNICLKEIIKNPTQPLYDNIEIAERKEVEIEGLIQRIAELKKKMEADCLKIIDLRFRLDEIESFRALNRDIGNRKFEEIAEILSIEPENARQRFGRCLEKLKKMLSHDIVWNELVSTN